MEKKYTIGVFAVLLIALVAGVSAYGFGMGNGMNQDDKDALMTAVENKDFETWKTLMQNQITEDKFNEIVDMHAQMDQVRDLRDQMREARDAGDDATFESLKAQIAELMPENPGFGGDGFERGMGSHKGMRNQVGDDFGPGSCLD